MHDLNYFPDGYQDAAEITLPEVWMNWLSMRNRLHALLFSDRITLKSPGRAHRNASGNNIQTIKDTTGSWVLVTRCQIWTGREPGRCHKENGNMISCKNYVCNAQSTTESTCISHKTRACRIYKPKRWRFPTLHTSPTHWLLLKMLPHKINYFV